MYWQISALWHCCHIDGVLHFEAILQWIGKLYMKRGSHLLFSNQYTDYGDSLTSQPWLPFSFSELVRTFLKRFNYSQIYMGTTSGLLVV